MQVEILLVEILTNRVFVDEEYAACERFSVIPAV